MTKLDREELALPEQRQWLIDAGMELAARTGARVELVFDGAEDEGQVRAVLGARVSCAVPLHESDRSACSGATGATVPARIRPDSRAHIAGGLSAEAPPRRVHR